MKVKLYPVISELIQISVKKHFCLYTHFAAASISTDNEAPQNMFCRGEELIFTCTSHDASHRWRLENYRGYPLAEQTFTTGDQVNRTTIKHEIYSFTLVQTNSRLVSRFSTVASSGLNNTIAECTDPQSQESVMIKIAGLLKQ